MLIWDAFLFNGELDMLECRLRELEQFPTMTHVIVESVRDFRGNRKPLYYADNLHRFSRWQDRIIYSIPALPDTNNPWHREFAARNSIFDVLWQRGAEPEDLVLLSDVDEIPKSSAIFSGAEAREPRVFEQRMSLYALEWIYPRPWCGTISCPFWMLNGVQDLRDQRNHLSRLSDGGWHLSWMGSLEEQSRKIESTCHTEMTDDTKEAIRTGRWIAEGWHSDGTKLQLAEFEEVDWPLWVRNRECPDSWFRQSRST